jgi:hypothetical protein
MIVTMTNLASLTPNRPSHLPEKLNGFEFYSRDAKFQLWTRLPIILSWVFFSWGFSASKEKYSKEVS